MAAEFAVEDVFYLSGGRTAFMGKVVSGCLEGRKFSANVFIAGQLVGTVVVHADLAVNRRDPELRSLSTYEVVGTDLKHSLKDGIILHLDGQISE